VGRSPHNRDPLAHHPARGDSVRLHGEYQSTVPAVDVMEIMLGSIHTMQLVSGYSDFWPSGMNVTVHHAAVGGPWEFERASMP
jgi:hypothetical protein